MFDPYFSSVLSCSRPSVGHMAIVCVCLLVAAILCTPSVLASTSAAVPYDAVPMFLRQLQQQQQQQHVRHHLPQQQQLQQHQPHGQLVAADVYADPDADETPSSIDYGTNGSVESNEAASTYAAKNRAIADGLMPSPNDERDSENYNSYSNDRNGGATAVDAADSTESDADSLAARRKRNMHNDFIRLGRQPHALHASSSFMRFGRGGGGQQPVRLDGFMRFGRAMPSFMRFGRTNAMDDAAVEGLRFGRRGDNFIRFGKRNGGGGGGGGSGGGEQISPLVIPMRAVRSDEGGTEQHHHLHQQQQLLLADAQQLDAAQRRLSDGLNRIERNGKEFIRFGRRDDAFVRLGKKNALDGGSQETNASRAEAADEV